MLAAGGAAVIGGGFGNLNLLREIEEKMLKRNPQWKEERQQRIGKTKVQEYQAELERQIFLRLRFCRMKSACGLS